MMLRLHLMLTFLTTFLFMNYLLLYHRNNLQSLWLYRRQQTQFSNRSIKQNISVTEIERTDTNTTLTNARIQQTLIKNKALNNTVEKYQNKSSLKFGNRIILEKNSNCSALGNANPNCLQYNFKRLISPRWTCQDSALLLMVVATLPQSLHRRNTLRKTWCSDFISVHGSIRHIFLIGKCTSMEEQVALEKEAAIHGDILQDDFEESYRNVTIKTIMAFRWFHEHCHNVSFIMKCDDDLFVNTFTLIPLLKQGKQMYHNSLLGKCGPGVVIRNPKHKWYVSKMQFAEKFYPSYCYGSGYIVGSSLAHKVAEVMPSVPIFSIEDAYLGQCVKQVKGKVTRMDGFHLRTYKGKKALENKLKTGDLKTLHKIDDSVISSYWQAALRINASKNIYYNVEKIRMSELL